MDNRSEEMVEFLLKYPQVEIGDTVMHAIRNNSTNILGKILLSLDNLLLIYSKISQMLSTYSFVVGCFKEDVSRIRIRWSDTFNNIPNPRYTADSSSTFE